MALLQKPYPGFKAWGVDEVWFSGPTKGKYLAEVGDAVYDWKVGISEVVRLDGAKPILEHRVLFGKTKESKSKPVGKTLPLYQSSGTFKSLLSVDSRFTLSEEVQKVVFYDSLSMNAIDVDCPIVENKSGQKTISPFSLDRGFALDTAITVIGFDAKGSVIDFYELAVCNGINLSKEDSTPRCVKCIFLEGEMLKNHPTKIQHDQGVVFRPEKHSLRVSYSDSGEDTIHPLTAAYVKILGLDFVDFSSAFPQKLSVSYILQDNEILASGKRFIARVYDVIPTNTEVSYRLFTTPLIDVVGKSYKLITRLQSSDGSISMDVSDRAVITEDGNLFELTPDGKPHELKMALDLLPILPGVLVDGQHPVVITGVTLTCSKPDGNTPVALIEYSGSLVGDCEFAQIDGDYLSFRLFPEEDSITAALNKHYLPLTERGCKVTWPDEYTLVINGAKMESQSVYSLLKPQSLNGQLVLPGSIIELMWEKVSNEERFYLGSIPLTVTE